ncbi:malate synthase A [Ferviditalea candida]|uniref:Malate synthase n=1 Tax=Ferviditalea candida TaxID=3108399 RepID=A0ABU5ZIT0_9BACL|nr:malate synthase A [Paenibacillaceae bacterium T2]
MKTELEDLRIQGSESKRYAEILTPEALLFVWKLHREFSGRLRELMEMREQRQKRFDQGMLPDFLEETRWIREGGWTIAPIPDDLQDRRVEITGPAGDAKMVINALNSGARVYMADFEDANSPNWKNTIEGQLNLHYAINGSLEYVSEQGRIYRLHEQTATLLVRPRGLHLPEKHVLIGGEPVPASLFDFGMFMFHNAEPLMDKGSGPYFYLPKLESHLEARWWNDVFVYAQRELGIPQGTIKATVLIETILAAFEADEILYELREHSCGLNCGRWDYIFSYIKKFRNNPKFILPDRAQVTMTVPFMKAYTSYVVKTCHKRNAHAIGGMAAQIPIKSDPAANEEAMRRVLADKQREAQEGHDGTWVAHPGLVQVAMTAFNQWMPKANQIERKREDVRVTAEDLLAVPEGTITEKGLRTNVSVAIQYMEAWLRGYGAVPIFNLMEDAATAEISRAQVWQWIRSPYGVLQDDRKITLEMVNGIVQEELRKIRAAAGDEAFENGKYAQAAELFLRLVQDDEFTEFLTMPGYDYLD